MAGLLPNFRYTLRGLGRNPGFTAIAVLSLALGIGATTAIFTLINALLLRNLPAPSPEELVELSAVRHDGDKFTFSYHMYRELGRGQQVFSGLFAWSPGFLNTIELNGQLAKYRVEAVTGNFYSELGATPLLGRLISQTDVDARSGNSVQVAVVGYEFWQSQLGGTDDVIGKEIRIEGQPFTIIGVTRPWFSGMMPGKPAALTIPVAAYPLLGRWITSLEGPDLWLHPTGRLKPGISLPQARAQLEAVWPAVLSATAPDFEPRYERQFLLSAGLDVSPGATGVIPDLRGEYTRPLCVLAGIVGLLLLLACVNLASLLLARAAARAQEMSVRVALGAGRWQLARQAFTESIVLSFAGAAAGLLFAQWGSRFLVSLFSSYEGALILFDLRPDGRVLLAASAAAVLTGLLCGLAPAWRAWREAPASALQMHSRSIARSAGRLGRILIITQVALSLVLILGAGLLVRTFQKLISQDFGFEKEHLLEVALGRRPGSAEPPDLKSYSAQLMSRLAALPSVVSASFSDVLFPAEGYWDDNVAPASSEPGSASGVMTTAAFVAPDFFRTLGIGLLQGRDFQFQDDQQHPRVAILSRHLAAKLYPQGEVIGQHIRFSVFPELQALEVVGVAADARLFRLRSGGVDLVYLTELQHLRLPEMSDLFLLLRTQGPPRAIARSVARELDALGHHYLYRAWTVDQVVGRQVVRERALAILSGFFAGLALLLASVGLFGLMSNAVARRTREIGIRSVLGEQRAAILWSVLREAFALVLAGVVIGIPCALAAGRLLAGFLFGVTTYDPVTLAAVVVVLFAAALVAAVPPARRAAGIDPIVALRAE